MIDRLVLHIGAGKTGTSAIQTGLARHRGKLATCGVYYPPHANDAAAVAGKTTSGNGEPVARFLHTNQRNKSVAPQDFDDWLAGLEAQAAGATLVLVSDESLHRADAHRLVLLRRSLERSFRDIAIVYYVRAAADFLASNYRQRIRQADYRGSFKQFISDEDVPYKRALEAFDGAFGRETIDVAVYELEQSDLFAGFLKKVAAGLSHPDAVETVNRSLTGFETRILRALGYSGLPPRLIQGISDRLVHTRAVTRTPFTITLSELDTIKARNQDAIDFVNAQYLGGEEVLKVCSDDIVVRPA